MTLKVEQNIGYSAAARADLTHSNEATWMKMLRENAIDRFNEIGFPAATDEDWKYTNVASFVQNEFQIGVESDPLSVEKISEFAAVEAANSRLIFVNGKLDAAASNVSNIEGARVLSLNDAAHDKDFAEIVKTNLARQIDYNFNGFTALNAALWRDGAFIFVPKDTKIDVPIQLLFITDGENTAAFPRVLIVLERGAEATIVESYARINETKYLTNATVEIILADDARLRHFRIQRESHNSLHVGATAASLQRNSFYDTTNINFGAALARHDVHVKFNAEGAECFVDGLYLTGETQHSDTHSIIDHAVPNCVSHQTYKGILGDKSRGVFNGKIFVRLNASGTNGYQSNKNLLLSNDARVDTKPQLEIFNDDVKCSHGATVGQLEPEEIFYLLSRGITPDLAKNLLTYGFAEEVINKINIASIKQQLDAAVLNRLDAQF